MLEFVLKIQARDSKGLVSAISGTIANKGYNIVKNDEFVDPLKQRFFMRLKIQKEIKPLNVEIKEQEERSLKTALFKALENFSELLIEVILTHKKNIILLVTKESHCLGDLLLRVYGGELNAQILGVISNHEILRPLVEKFDIPYFYAPCIDQVLHEKEVLAIIKNLELKHKVSADLLVLAKYMRILSHDFTKRYENQILNIHHSFLPAFIGANPYQQAFERGVKVIGATAHFVNESLDAGPIIIQDTLPINHNYSVEKMRLAGKDIEKLVLARALKLVLEDRVFVHENKTVVFWMPLDFSSLNEEPLKSSVAKAFFENFDFSGDKIDFIITYNHKNKGKPLWVEPILWAEGKKGKSELFKSLAQLILTIGKHKFYTHFPPPYLGAFDAFSFLFVEYHKLDFIFTRSDIDFSVTPSNHNTESFKHLLNELTPLLEKEAYVKERIKNGAKLLENHVFQFDFLNDDFFGEKVPKSLQEILKDKEKLKKLIIYINPPYAEATGYTSTSKDYKHKPKVARNNKVYETYKDLLGRGANEVFAQFFMRIYKELNGVILASFSTLKNLQGSNFKKFREVFKAEFKGGFMVPADTFDNVKGQFPIGFLAWDTSSILPKENPLNLGGNSKEEKQNSNLILDQDNLKDNPLKEHFYAVSLEIFDSFGGFLGTKNIVIDDENNKPIIHFLRPFYDKSNEPIGFLRFMGADFSTNISTCLCNHLTINDVREVKYTPITHNNIAEMCIYFSIRYCIKATWQNDRDQFYAPCNDAWQDDNEFKNNSLAFCLFHNQNRIMNFDNTKKYGKFVEINHFIPFDEEEVGAKERYSSHALLDFLKGKIKEEGDSLFLNAKKENKPLEFSLCASKVFDAGREIYRYYHAQDFTNHDYNTNASLYDIKEFFQGRNAQGKLNLPAKAKDKHYKQLYANLQDALKDLAKEIQPKVYEYGFLRE